MQLLVPLPYLGLYNDTFMCFKMIRSCAADTFYVHCFFKNLQLWKTDREEKLQYVREEVRLTSLSFCKKRLKQYMENDQYLKNVVEKLRLQHPLLTEVLNIF